MGFEICAIQNNIVTRRTDLHTLYRFQSPYTVLYCTVLYCTVLHCTVMYCTVLCLRVTLQVHSSRSYTEAETQNWDYGTKTAAFITVSTEYWHSLSVVSTLHSSQSVLRIVIQCLLSVLCIHHSQYYVFSFIVCCQYFAFITVSTEYWHSLYVVSTLHSSQSVLRILIHCMLSVLCIHHSQYCVFSFIVCCQYFTFITVSTAYSHSLYVVSSKGRKQFLIVCLSLDVW